jgi:DNA repair exonuclease SbcCD nuclease subunit
LGTVGDVIRFLHTADWQLGMTRHFLDGDAQPRFTAARLDAVRAVGHLAQSEGCAFVVVCGDVFESNHVERQVVVRALQAMAEFDGVTFYLLPGNHDPLDAASVYESQTFRRHQPANVVVLTDVAPRVVAPGVELVAAPWSSKHPLVDLVDAACRELPANGVIRVVVGHGIVDVLSPDRNDPATISLDLVEGALQEGRVHYVALGDRHSTTSVGTSGRVWYAGAPEPTDYDEVNPGNVLLVEVTATGCHVDIRAIGTWQFLLHHAELAGPDDVDRLGAWLASIARPDRSIVKLSMVGQLSIAQKAALDSVLDHHEALLAALEIWDRRSDLVVLPDDADEAALHLSGFARDAARDLGVLAAGNDADALIARDALALLYRLQAGAS